MSARIGGFAYPQRSYPLSTRSEEKALSVFRAQIAKLRLSTGALREVYRYFRVQDGDRIVHVVVTRGLSGKDVAHSFSEVPNIHFQTLNKLGYLDIEYLKQLPPDNGIAIDQFQRRFLSYPSLRKSYEVATFKNRDSSVHVLFHVDENGFCEKIFYPDQESLDRASEDLSSRGYLNLAQDLLPHPFPQPIIDTLKAMQWKRGVIGYQLIQVQVDHEWRYVIATRVSSMEKVRVYVFTNKEAATILLKRLKNKRLFLLNPSLRN